MRGGSLTVICSTLAALAPSAAMQKTMNCTARRCSTRGSEKEPLSPGPLSVLKVAESVTGVDHTGVGMRVGLELGEGSGAALFGEGSWPTAQAA